MAAKRGGNPRRARLVSKEGKLRVGHEHVADATAADKLPHRLLSREKAAPHAFHEKHALWTLSRGQEGCRVHNTGSIIKVLGLYWPDVTIFPDGATIETTVVQLRV